VTWNYEDIRKYWTNLQNQRWIEAQEKAAESAKQAFREPLPSEEEEE